MSPIALSSPSSFPLPCSRAPSLLLAVKIMPSDPAATCILLIDGRRYDVTRFLKEHPGGKSVLLEHNGKDATEAFREVGHSYSAKQTMRGFLVDENGVPIAPPTSRTQASPPSGRESKSIGQWISSLFKK